MCTPKTIISFLINHCLAGLMPLQLVPFKKRHELLSMYKKLSSSTGSLSFVRRLQSVQCTHSDSRNKKTINKTIQNVQDCKYLFIGRWPLELFRIWFLPNEISYDRKNTPPCFCAPPFLKQVCVFAIVATVALAEPKAEPKADPKPTVFAYSAPAVAAEVPVATVYETSFHGNLAPVAAYSAPVLTAPLAYSYSYYDPLVAAPILLRK